MRDSISIRTIGCLFVLVFLLTTGRALGKDKVDVVFDSGDPSHVVTPGGEQRVALVLTNSGDEPVEVSVQLEVESFDGAVATAQADQTVPASGSLRWKLPKQAFGEFGIKWVRFWTRQHGLDSTPQQASFAYMKPVGPTDGRAEGFLFGIAYGAGPDNYAEQAARRAAMCGVKIARGHPAWPRIQPKPDQWDWSSCDAIVDAHAKFGIEIQLLLAGAPRWAWQTSGEGVPTVDAWSTWCRELARRYRGKVRYYELWNEPDIDFFRGTIEQYLVLLRAGYRAIHEIDPAAQVTTGGFASWTHQQTKPGMVPRVLRECADSYDLVAYHRHGEFAGFRNELEQYLLPFVQKGLDQPKRLYFTETGMDTRFGEHFQACTLPKKIAFAWAQGAVAYNWFNLHDMQAAEHARQPGFTYGLFTKLARLDPSRPHAPENMDYAHAWPKAAYVAYNTLTTLLAGKQFAGQMALDRPQYAFVFSGHGEHVVLAWNEESTVGSTHLVLSTDAGHVERCDLMGNRRSWPAADGRTVLALSEEPAYLVFEGGKPPRLEGSLVAPASDLAAIPGRPLTVAATVWNPTLQPVAVEAQWHVAEGLQGVAAPQRLNLAPGQLATTALEVSTPARAAVRFGHVFPCTLEYRVAPTGWSGKVAIPVRMGAVLLGSDLPKPPTFRLDAAGQVVNLSEHDPHTVHLLWKGPRDLSADVRLACADDGLRIQLDVQDDVHHAPSAEKLASGDHAELFLQVPGQEGLWKVLLARVDGKPQAVVAQAPPGQASAAGVQLRAWGDSPAMHYSAILPADHFGLTRETLRQGVRMNLRIHDDDGRGHKGWIEIAAEESPSAWPLLLLQTAER